MQRGHAAWLSLLLLVGSASPAFSQKKGEKPKTEEEKRREEARAAFDEAEKYYKLLQYDEALKFYQRAYLLSNEPLLLFNIGQCYRQLGDTERAIKTYQNFLRENPTSDIRAKVEGILAELDAARSPEPPASGTLSSEAVAAGVNALGQDLGVCYRAELPQNPAWSPAFSLAFTVTTAGTARDVSLVGEGLPERFQGCVRGVVEGARFQAPQGGAVAVSYPLSFVPPKAEPGPASIPAGGPDVVPPAPAGGEGGAPVLSYGLLGGAGAGAIVSAILLGTANGAWKDAAALQQQPVPADGLESRVASLEATLQKARSLSLAGDLAVIGTVGLAVGGVVTLVRANKEEPKTAQLTLSPGGFVLSGRF